MTAYEQYRLGKLQDFEYPSAAIEEAMTHLPKVNV
jgi:hypothetical protein